MLTQGWMMCVVIVVVVLCVMTDQRSGHALKEVRRLQEPSTPIASLHFSPSSPWLASCETGGRLSLWKLPATAPVQECGGEDRKIKCVAFSPIREQVAWGDWDGTIVLWDLRTRTQLEVLQLGEASISALEFSPGGTTLAAGDASGAVGLWDVEEGRVMGVLETQARLITALDFSSDGRLIAAAGVDDSGGRLMTWEAPGGTPRRQFPLPSRSLVRTIEFLPGDDRVLWLDVGRQRLGSWDLARGESDVMLDERHRLTSVALSPDGRTLALGTSEGGVHLRDRETLEVTHRLRSQPNPIQSLDFSADGRLVAVGGVVAGVLVWAP
ncbi:WD40 repeat domain-containing protein [Tautonia sp. JC769]|uniref:WD40 repeat domain-containing protein n=1 Tax=Tautonia sp. JC769 TaxID=3232135 RepID=UPI00345898D3